MVIFDPVPKENSGNSTPCGTCRAVIWEFGTPDTTVICGQYIQEKNGWRFLPQMEKFAIKELYPKPFNAKKWD